MYEIRITFKSILLTFKCLHVLAPQYVSPLLSSNSPTCSLHYSDQLLLKQPTSLITSVNDPSLVQPQDHDTNYVLQSANLRVLIILKLHSHSWGCVMDELYDWLTRIIVISSCHRYCILMKSRCRQRSRDATMEHT